MDVYRIYNEEKMKYPIIVNIPHSGTFIPNEIKDKFINPSPIIANNDWFLNELYDFLIDLDVTVLSANYSRYVVDVNRIVTKPVIGDNYNKYTIYEKTIWGKPLYKDIPSNESCNERLEKYYYPYHKKLNEIINKKLEKFEKVLVLDLHSGASSTGDKDICLGNANFEMSSKETIENLKKLLEKEGYTVSLNTPMTGGKILRKYHSENSKIECIIFELNFNQYIENRYIAEEEVKEYNNELFNSAKIRLKNALSQYLIYLNNK